MKYGQGTCLPDALPPALAEMVTPEMWAEAVGKSKSISRSTVRKGVTLGILSMGQSAAWGLFDGWKSAKKHGERQLGFPGLNFTAEIHEAGEMPCTGTMVHDGMTGIWTKA